MNNENPHNNQAVFKKYYGKYRGKVIQNIDPDGLGRIIADVPYIPGSKTNFATPCMPYAGKGVGFLALPPIGANVWIEFEGGDPTFPIWSGCFWAPNEVPTEIFGPDKKIMPEKKIFKTDHITMILDDQKDQKGGFSLTCKTPAVKVQLTMTFDAQGITITCPQQVIKMTTESITLTAPQSKIYIDSKTVKTTVPNSVIEVTASKIDAQVPSSSASMTAGKIEVKTTNIDTTAAGSIKEKAAKVDVTANVAVTGTVKITGNTTITGLVKMN